jgi:uncharacterized membrane protein
MADIPPRATLSICGVPLHATIVPFPLVCFVGTLCTDIAYWRTAAMLWADMSAWLLLVGVVTSVLAIAAGLIDFLAEPRVRAVRGASLHALCSVAVLVLSIFNSLIHTRDAYTSVVPAGLILSAVVVAIILIAAWSGWTMVYRHKVGVGLGRSP